jgi:hypothetical protein
MAEFVPEEMLVPVPMVAVMEVAQELSVRMNTNKSSVVIFFIVCGIWLINIELR